ncbi:VPLPA-CTERM-specific exosortase XrtD [Methylomonas methanica]|uniref:EpsI family protein n=1 Tax=Methylomonas methanica (strain DSM 25384 / MC09) TaxID=857087 RepID=G0A237_METMM|nr:VPLPA-CTERM-specific exosortase XrtD [Methylomonas methanica]AEG02580.1 EpsI family protein [Methylomonas methanica MC09]
MQIDNEINSPLQQNHGQFANRQTNCYWYFSHSTWLVLGAALALMLWAYWDGLANLLHRWEVEEEYNHGYFLPLMTLLFLWQLRPQIITQSFQPAWGALALACAALLMFIVGELSAIYLLIHYSFILLLFALSLAMVGWAGTMLTFAAIGILVFAVPIPYFLEATITSKLQLLSSKFGVNLIRFCNIPVFREGNLIDLGVFKLEVIEACSGLTYLYPLLGFGAICAYMYRTETWKRVLIVLSTIPIAILLNSFRIGMIGFLVKYFGGEQARGFLHDFEGFAVFMVCVGILFLEIWLLTFVGRDRRPFNQVFGLKLEPIPEVPAEQIAIRPLPRPLLVCTGLIAVTAVAMSSIEAREEIKPERTYFSAFPKTIGEWQGMTGTLEAEALKTLDLTDYFLADFSKPTGVPVNFYVAYYESQRKGASPHSPTVCMPGGGWQIIDLNRRTFPETATEVPFEFNRVVIRKGNQSQLVYYWFEERGRVIADEYQVKWHLFRDALLENRTDGALVRLTTPMVPGEPEEKADQRIADFLAGALPLLTDYVPK